MACGRAIFGKNDLAKKEKNRPISWGGFLIFELGIFAGLGVKGDAVAPLRAFLYSALGCNTKSMLALLYFL
ncbi:MAG: hypothetical protein SPH02_04680 [Campylobacter sp.]|nr:hypothetical protein [Campylobacter sp.]